MAVSDYDAFIRDASSSHDVDPDFLRATMGQESSGNPHLTGADGEVGLMQIMPSTARQVGYTGSVGSATNLTGLYDPQTNIEYGTRYEAWQLERYHGNYADAAAAYNAGSVIKNKDGTYVNQAYVDSVRRRYNKEKGLPENTPLPGETGPIPPGGGGTGGGSGGGGGGKPIPQPTLGPRHLTNPYHATPFVEFAGFIFHVVPPYYLVEFSYIDNMDSGADEWELRVFDATGITVEAKIIDIMQHGAIGDAKLRWGYTNGEQSEEKILEILDYQVTGLTGGVAITVSGFSADRAEHRIKKAPEKFKLPIHDIVQHIADRNGWVARIGPPPHGTIEETVVIQDKETSLSGRDEIKTFTQKNQTDWQFLTYLAQHSEMKREPHLHDYKVYFRNGSELHFHPPFKENDVSREYYYNTREADIISYSPQIVGRWLAFLGGGKSKCVGYDFYEDKSIERTNDYQHYKPRPILNAKPILQEIEEVGRDAELHNRVYYPSVFNKFHFDIWSASMWERWFNTSNQLVIEVVGDPRVEAGHTVMVYAFVNNRLHYTSGKYLVFRATHHIGPAGYITTHELYADSLSNQNDLNTEIHQ